MSEERSRVTIDVDQAIAALRGLGAQADSTGKDLKSMGDQGDKAAGTLDRVKGAGMMAVDGLKSIALAATAAGAALALAAGRGSELNGLSASFERLGNDAAKLQTLRDATQGLVSDMTLQRLQNMAQLSGLSADAVQQLAQVAVGASTSMGLNFEESFERIILSSAKMERETLDELGIRIPNLTQVYKDFATQAGVSVNDLTEAQKQQSFIQAILANSTNQLAIAQDVGGDAFGRVATKVKNAEDQMMMYINSLLDSSGIIDLVGSVVETLTSVLNDNRESIETLITQGAQVFAEVLPVLVEALLQLVPVLLETLPIFIELAPALKGVGALIQVLTPLVTTLATVLNTGLAYALKIVFSILQGIIAPIAAVVSAIDADLGAALKRAQARMHEASEEMGQAQRHLKRMADQSSKSAQATKQAASAMQGAAASTKQLTAAQPALQDGVLRSAKALQAEAKAAAEMSEKFQIATDIIRQFGSEEQLGKLKIGDVESEDRLKTILSGTDEARENFKALRRAQDGAADGAKELAERFSDTGLKGEELISVMIAQQEELQALKREALTVEGRSIEDLPEYMRQGVDDRLKVAQELDSLITDLDAAIDLATEQESAAVKAQKGKGSTTKEADDTFLDDMRAATELLGSEMDRRRLELEEKYGSLIIALRGKNDEMADALTSRLDLELFAMQFEGASDRIALSLEESLAPSLAQIKQAGVELKAIGSMPQTEEMRAALESLRANGEATLGVVEALGSNAADLFEGLADGSLDSADAMRSAFGSFFSDLSSVFIAWASAQIANMFNPLAGLAASLAFQAIVAPLLGSFAKKGVSASRGSAGASSASAARRTDRERPDRDQKPGIVINQYGFATPDEIAMSIGHGTRRAAELRGRSS